MTKHTAAHTVTGLFLAALAALGAAFAVVLHPTLPGEAATGALCAYAIAHQLRKSKLVRKGSEALLLGVTVAVLAIVFLPAALPPAIFAALALRPALHFLDPRKTRVVRTTRGVKSPARKAAGGRTGRPGEKPHAPRTRPAAARPAPRRAEPAHTVTLKQPAPEPVTGTWPHAGEWDYAAALPWAGEGTVMAGDEPVTGRKLARRADRPSKVHRALCPDCVAQECQPGPCRDRGCECPAEIHDTPPF